MVSGRRMKVHTDNHRHQFVPTATEVGIHIDDRGVFVPFFTASKGEGIDEKFNVRRVYYVTNHSVGVVRGLHLHQHEWKLFVIVNGAAKFFAVCQEHKRERYSFVSSDKKPFLISIPPGFLHGWVSLEHPTTLVCISNASLEESLRDDKRVEPFKFGDVWRIQPR